jgi:hypothetical protein
MIFLAIDTGLSRSLADKPRPFVSRMTSALPVLFVRVPRARKLIRKLPDHQSIGPECSGVNAARLECRTGHHSVTPILHHSVFSL